MWCCAFSWQGCACESIAALSEVPFRFGRVRPEEIGGIRDSPAKSPLDESDHVTLWVREQRERDPARDLDWRQYRRATEPLDLLQRPLGVIDSDVEGDVARSLLGLADAAVDATAILHVNHAVLQRPIVGSAQLPAERLRVELPQGSRITPQDLEMDDRIPHLILHDAQIAPGYMTTSVIITD